MTSLKLMKGMFSEVRIYDKSECYMGKISVLRIAD
jgi:hypothetical protein